MGSHETVVKYLHVSGHVCSELSLNGVPVDRSIVVDEMKQCPDFETWVGECNSYPLRFGQGNSTVDIRVLIAVKNHPDLISFLEAVPPTTLTPLLFDSFLYNALRDPDPRDEFNSACTCCALRPRPMAPRTPLRLPPTAESLRSMP